jgi:hypothetical protein
VQPQLATSDAAANLANTRHEPADADVRTVWRTGAILAAIVAASFVVIAGLLGGFANVTGGKPASQSHVSTQDRSLADQLRQLRLQEQQLLEKYEWVDQTNGIARIPVDRAMEIVSKTGLPTELPQSESAAARPNTKTDDSEEQSEPNEINPR